jgi:hypothetical protein
MIPVRVAEPGRASLLALFLRSILERRLAGRTALPIEGDVLVEGGRMRVRITFRPGEVLLGDGPLEGSYRARIRGDLASLLDFALGRRRIAHFLSGRIEAEGPIRLLLSLSRLLVA